jgi:outer membrane protein OmpA-like peptidoglycan-associated protein/tetratricopeptide (TPR) repeat protein
MEKQAWPKVFFRYSGILLFACLLQLILLPLPLRAQEQGEADRYYQVQQFYKAAQLYSDLLEEDEDNYYASYQLAHCYRRLFRYAEARPLYRKVAEKAYRNYPLSLYYYAQSLKLNEEYSQAVEVYRRVLSNPRELIPERFLQEARKEQQGCFQALLETPANAGKDYSSLPGPLNTGFHEYAPLFRPGNATLFFTSSRPRERAILSNRSGDGFPDMYYCQPDSSSEQVRLMETVSSRESEAGGCFSPDGSHFYFTRCDQRSGYCRIYVSEFKNGKWAEEKALNKYINREGSNSKHPGLSVGGDTLFFVSDREGGRGGTDIWMSVAQNGQWQPATNLGPRVNSREDEVAPFILPKDGLLVFSSNGRVGYGGMDFYVIPLPDLTAAEPLPVLPPFNSSRDDAYLARGSTKLFWASNRKGDFDIFALPLTESASVYSLLTGISPSTASKRKAPAPMPGGVIPPPAEKAITLEMLHAMRTTGSSTMKNGSSRFVLSADVNDILLEKFRDRQAIEERQEQKEGPGEEGTIRLAGDLLLSFATRQLENGQQAELLGKLSMAATAEPAAEVLLYLLDENGQVVKISTTNEEGQFRFANLLAGQQYSIGTDNATDASGVEIADVRIVGYSEDVSTLRFENIYFDFNQTYLRAEAKVVLEDLADYYRQHPEIVIEINAFTDSTGNDQYNMELSRRRGNSAYDYLLSQGVDRSSLVINAKGVSTAISTSNSFVSQQMNRRVEFYITGKDVAFEPTVVTRIPRPDVNLQQLARISRVSRAEIMRLNGLSEAELQPYKPIRIYREAVERAPQLFYQMQLRSE